ARRDVEAFGEELEVMDQRFHRLLHLSAPRRRNLAVEAEHWTFRHFRKALLHDARGLIDFLDADHEAIIAVATRADRHVELHAVIDVVRLRLAQIPRDASRADHRTGKAPFDRVFAVHDRDIDVALLED